MRDHPGSGPILEGARPAPPSVRRRLRGLTMGSGEPPQGASLARASMGFTLIELIVVIGIIVMAAGLMAPTITDFFRSRQLDNVRGQIGTAFNRARQDAVTYGRPVSVVFFREGVRVFNEYTKQFADDLFDPQQGPLSTDKLWYVLGFLQGLPSTSLPQYQDWEDAQKRSARAERSAAGDDAGDPNARKSDAIRFDVRKLPRLTYLRDGSASFPVGTNVDSNLFRAEPPENADIIVYQDSNSAACFIDIRPQGQLRSKVSLLTELARRPEPASPEGVELEEGR